MYPIGICTTTTNYRFVCPQLASTAKIAEVHHKHYGIYEKPRCESLNPEAQKYPKAMKFQKVHFCGQVQMKLANNRAICSIKV